MSLVEVSKITCGTAHIFVRCVLFFLLWYEQYDGSCKVSVQTLLHKFFSRLATNYVSAMKLKTSFTGSLAKLHINFNLEHAVKALHVASVLGGVG
jgi:hypothetical protein